MKIQELIVLGTGGNFGDALEELKKGGCVTREGWNGKGMFLFLVDGSRFKVSRAPLNKIFPEGTTIDYCPHIDLKDAHGKISTWAPSIQDTLAEDWQSVKVKVENNDE